MLNPVPQMTDHTCSVAVTKPGTTEACTRHHTSSPCYSVYALACKDVSYTVWNSRLYSGLFFCFPSCNAFLHKYLIRQSPTPLCKGRSPAKVPPKPNVVGNNSQKLQKLPFCFMTFTCFFLFWPHATVSQDECAHRNTGLCFKFQ